MKTDTSEKGLEKLIVEAMVGQAAGEGPPPGEGISLIRERYGGTGGIPGQAEDYDREFCVDLPSSAPSFTPLSRKLPKPSISPTIARPGVNFWPDSRERSRSAV